MWPAVAVVAVLAVVGVVAAVQGPPAPAPVPPRMRDLIELHAVEQDLAVVRALATEQVRRGLAASVTVAASDLPADVLLRLAVEGAWQAREDRARIVRAVDAAADRAELGIR